MSIVKALSSELAEQRLRILRMSDAERKKYADQMLMAKRAEEARQRLVGYRTAARPESVELVKFTAMRGMSRKRMDEIWGSVFVRAVLGDRA